MYVLASLVTLGIGFAQVVSPPATTPVRELTRREVGLTTPGPPTGVVATREKDDVVVTWKAIGLAKIVGYEVHRRIGDKPLELIGAVKEARFTDKGAPKANVEYAVLARDRYDNKSVPSKPVSPTDRPRQHY
jgi:hypothetical protein